MVHFKVKFTLEFFDKTFDFEEISLIRYDSRDVPSDSSVYRVWSSDYRKSWKPEDVKRMPMAPWEVCSIAVLLGIVHYVGFLSTIFATLLLFILFIVFLAITVWQIGRLLFWLGRKYSLCQFKKSPEEIKRQGEREKKREEEAEKRKARLEAEEKALAIQKEERYRVWLLDNYSLTKKPERVVLANVPVPLSKKERAIQVFRVSFWALKAKVCRPYAK